MNALKLIIAFLAALSIFFAHAAPGAHGANGEHLDNAVSNSGSGLARLPDGVVNIPKLAQRRMGIITALGVESQTSKTVELPGRVIVDPNASGRIQTTHGGRIESGPKGLPIVGQKVLKGEVLGYVRHHSDPYAIGNQQALLAEITAQRLIADKKAKRLSLLEGTVPRKDIEAAQTEAESLMVKEKSIGNSLTARAALLAPVSGVIAKAELMVGQVVEPKDILIEVIDPVRLLIEATTSDPKIAAQIKTASLQGVEGIELKFLGGAKSYRDGLLPIVFALKTGRDLSALPLAIGQPVTVLAQLPEQMKGIVLPAQAVSKSITNEPIVWIKLGFERYLQQPIQYQNLSATQIVVTQGLAPDNRVVVQGAALISQIR